MFQPLHASNRNERFSTASVKNEGMLESTINNERLCYMVRRINGIDRNHSKSNELKVRTQVIIVTTGICKRGL
ncbi:hypothetical protein EG68_12135 [Paragonimus skrjabini miyazakii]|uniref:Uncharacterized protein n=1 Tax=Paragonimus skrjabini miyazakii TaxID=59628 RepID=A0A8S9YCT6_9TREM|nr:hypothetical protein EG68_12135 [Paragonimus skrjabini miyazakii]